MFCSRQPYHISVGAIRQFTRNIVTSFTIELYRAKNNVEKYNLDNINSSLESKKGIMDKSKIIVLS